MSGSSTPRGRGRGLDSDNLLKMVMKMSADHAEQLNKVHTESSQRASLAAFHALSEVRSTAESAQTHMTMQPVLQSTMALGHTQQAAALLYQQAGAGALRMAHHTQHMQFQAAALSGTPVSVAQGNEQQTAQHAQQSAMPNLSLFALPAAEIQQQLPMPQQLQLPMQQGEAA